jgi:hypothetical protein
MIKTIKELKEIIKDLPDDMEVMGYKGGNGDLWWVSHWIISEDTLTEEEIKDGYPDGVIPTLVIDIG